MTTKENVANMLPIVTPSGPVLSKKENCDIKETEKDIDDIDEEIEESVKDFILNYKTKFEISHKVRSLTVDLAILKIKLKFADKKNTKKVTELKRDIIRKEREKRKYSNELEPEAKAELKKLEKEAETQAIKEFKDVEKEMDSELKKSEVKKESVEETVIEKTDDKEDKKEEIPSELKRVDELRGKLEDLKRSLEEAKDKFKETSETIYEKKIKGLTYKIEKLEAQIKEDEKKLEEKAKKDSKEKEVKESVEIDEAANMEDEIKPIVNKLNDLGYKVKYASPGHKQLRKKEDSEPDGVYYGKLYSDARIMFDNKYDFDNAPEFWHWRDVDGCSYLDITPIAFDYKKGTPDEQFSNWKESYMNSLKEFVDNLSKDKKDDSDEETVESVMANAFSKFGMDDEFTEGFFNFGKKKESESDKLKKQIEQLKKDKAEGKISPLDFTKKLKEVTDKYQQLTSNVGSNLKTSFESEMDDLLSEE